MQVRIDLRALFGDDPDFLVVTDSFMIGAENQQLFRDVTAASVRTNPVLGAVFNQLGGN